MRRVSFLYFQNHWTVAVVLGERSLRPQIRIQRFINPGIPSEKCNFGKLLWSFLERFSPPQSNESKTGERNSKIKTFQPFFKSPSTGKSDSFLIHRTDIPEIPSFASLLSLSRSSSLRIYSSRHFDVGAG